MNCFFPMLHFLFPFGIFPFVLQARNLKLVSIMAIWLEIFLMLVPFFVIMVLENARRKRQIRDEEDDEEGYGGSEENPEEEDYAEEEVGSGEPENIDSPTKQGQTPLWKYVQRMEGGKGGGTTKFICPHCNKQYHGSYTRARKHLCGKMPGDGDKNIGIKICTNVLATQREKYRKEEEASLQRSSKRSRGFIDSGPTHHGQTSSTSTHASGFGSSGTGLRRRTISDFLDEGCRNDVDSKVYRFLYACGVPFNVLRSPYWHEMVSAINDAPKGYKSPGYDKARTVGLDHEKAKINNSLARMTSSWNEHGLSVVSDGWTNVKGKPLINVLAVSVSGAVFLAAYDY